ncbi:hypothetical protein ACOMHN_014771 [Nucella lapillus]
MASGGGGPPPRGKSMGRGGRGLAILQALKKEQMAPGQAPEAHPGSMPSAGRVAGILPQPQAQPQAQPLAAPQPPLARPQPAVSQPSVSASSQAPVGGLPTTGRGGRGNLAGMFAMIQQQQGGFRGRGGVLAQVGAGAWAEAPSKPVPPSEPAAPTPSPPVPQAAAPPAPAGMQAAPTPAGMQAGEPAPPVGAMASLSVREPEQPRQDPAPPHKGPPVIRRGVPGAAGGEP